MENFITTSDVNTANQLKKAGFTQINNSNNIFTFLNCKTLNFEKNNIDISKIKYSNNLCI